MDWFVLAIISVFLGSVSFILQRVLMKDKDSDSFTYSIVFQILCTLIVGAYAFYNGFVMPDIKTYALNYLLGAILYGAGTVFVFNAYKLLEASQIAIITSTNALWTILLALIFLNEPFTMQNFIGTILIISAIVLINVSKKGIIFNKGTIYALLFAVCFGIALVNDKYVLMNSGADAISYTAIIFLFPTLMLMLAKPAALLKINTFLNIKLLGKMILFSSFYAISAILFFVALNSGATASQLAPINKSSVIITVILAALFLGEKDHLYKKVIAALLVMIGVYLLR